MEVVAEAAGSVDETKEVQQFLRQCRGPRGGGAQHGGRVAVPEGCRIIRRTQKVGNISLETI